MMFAHGYGCDQNMWRYVTPAFADTHRIVLFDHVGNGKSDLSAYDEEQYSTLDGYADDVLEIVHEHDLRDVVFVGHSVSAMIGVLAAIREPERFAKLVLIGPSPRYIDDATATSAASAAPTSRRCSTSLDSNYLGWSSAMAPVIMGNPDRPELGAELTNSFCRTDPEIASKFARVTLPLRQPRRPAAPPYPGADPAMLRRRHRADRGRRLRPSAPGREHTGVHERDRPLPNLSAPEETVAAIKAYL